MLKKINNKNTIPHLLVIIIFIGLLPLIFLILNRKINLGDSSKINESYATGVPPQGIYDSCALSSEYNTCISRLDKVASAGFRYIVNYKQFYGSERQIIDYANKANSLGLKIIWNFSTVTWHDNTAFDDFYSLGKSCNCSTRDELLTYVTNIVKNHPATWGYYIGDEATLEMHSSVKTLSTLVGKVDPNHPRLFVHWYSGVTCIDNIRPYTDVSEYIALDIYPLANQRPTTDVKDCAEKADSFVNQNNKKLAIALQAFAGSQYSDRTSLSGDWPTREQMREMRDYAITTAHPEFVLWYNLSDIMKSDDPVKHWNDLVWAANITPPPIATQPPSPPTTQPPLALSPIPSVSPINSASPTKNVLIPLYSTSASSSDGNKSKNTVDKKLTTRWSTSGNMQWVMYTFQKQQIVDYLKIAFYEGDKKNYYFSIETSNDKTSWKEIYSKESSKTNNYQTFNLPNTSAKYLRILIKRNSKNLLQGITETEIYGY